MTDTTLLHFHRRAPKITRAVPNATRKLCRHRASKRWSSLLTQTRSRIGHDFGMRERLGEASWRAFVRYAVKHHKVAFLNALVPPDAALRCAGKLARHTTAVTPCTRRLCLATAPLSEVKRRLANFHMDHTHDAALICQVWSDALPVEPESWDDGICGPLVAQLLFGVHDHPMADADPANPLWKAQLVIRCGNTRGVAGQRAFQFCHDVAHAHYTHPLTVEDLRLGDETAVADETAVTDETAVADETNTEDDTEVDATEVDATEDFEDDDDDETLPPDEEELAEALVDAMTDASSVDLTLEDGANADNPIELWLPYLEREARLTSPHSEVDGTATLGHGGSHGVLGFVGDGVAEKI